LRGTLARKSGKATGAGGAPARMEALLNRFYTWIKIHNAILLWKRYQRPVVSLY
jgi:hypothetical protein